MTDRKKDLGVVKLRHLREVETASDDNDSVDDNDIVARYEMGRYNDKTGAQCFDA